MGKPRCYQCRLPECTCYCSILPSIQTAIQFVFLMHPLENKRSFVTGRMTHRCLKDSVLLTDTNFTDHTLLNQLLADPSYQPFVLFPGKSSHNLSRCSAHENASMFKGNRRPLILVIDGTWSLAQKILYRNEQLQALPQICFDPKQASKITMRRQPHPKCLCTLEATAQLMEEFATIDKFSSETKNSLELIKFFEQVVSKWSSFKNQDGHRHRIRKKKATNEL